MNLLILNLFKLHNIIYFNNYAHFFDNSNLYPKNYNTNFIKTRMACCFECKSGSAYEYVHLLLFRDDENLGY